MDQVSNILMQVNFRSEVLLLWDSMNIILPKEGPEHDIPVLWLLHGGGGNENDWLHATRIRAYADKHQIAVVMAARGLQPLLQYVLGRGLFRFPDRGAAENRAALLPVPVDQAGGSVHRGLLAGWKRARSPWRCAGRTCTGTVGVISASSIIPLEHLRPKSAAAPRRPRPGTDEREHGQLRRGGYGRPGRQPGA